MLALPPAPAPARPRLLIIATALFAGAVFVLFVSLISIYLDLRHQAGGTTALWLPAKVRPSIVVGNLMFFGMLERVGARPVGAVRHRPRQPA